MNKQAQAAIEMGDLHLALRCTVELKLAALDNDSIHQWYYLDQDERNIRELIRVADNRAMDQTPTVADCLRDGFDRLVRWASVNRERLVVGASVGGLAVALIFAVAYPVS